MGITSMSERKERLRKLKAELIKISAPVIETYHVDLLIHFDQLDELWEKEFTEFIFVPRSMGVELFYCNEQFSRFELADKDDHKRYFHVTAWDEVKRIGGYQAKRIVKNFPCRNHTLLYCDDCGDQFCDNCTEVQCSCSNESGEPCAETLLGMN